MTEQNEIHCDSDGVTTNESNGNLTPEAEARLKALKAALATNANASIQHSAGQKARLLDWCREIQIDPNTPSAREHLKEIKELGLYQAVEHCFDVFCAKHLGIDDVYALLRKPVAKSKGDGGNNNSNKPADNGVTKPTPDDREEGGNAGPANVPANAGALAPGQAAPAQAPSPTADVKQEQVVNAPANQAATPVGGEDVSKSKPRVNKTDLVPDANKSGSKAPPSGEPGTAPTVGKGSSGDSNLIGAGAAEVEVQVPLTTEERKTLAKHEATIAAGWTSFVGVGRALAAIRESGLYREEYPDFESYCKTRWRIGKSQRCRLMGAAAVMESLSASPIGDRLPENEAQCRALVSLKPEQRTQAWRAALEKAGDKPVTARVVQAAAAAFIPAEQEPQIAEEKTTTKRHVSPLKLVTNIEKAVAEDADKEQVLALLKDLKGILKAAGHNPGGALEAA